MNNKTLFYVAAIFLILSIADFIGTNYSIRLVGLNLLNIRVWLIALAIATSIFKPNKLTTISMRWLYAYFAVFLVLEMFGHYDLWGFSRTTRYEWFRDQHYAVAGSLFLSELFLDDESKTISYKLAKLGYWLILLVCLLSIVAIFRNPAIVRGSGFRNTNISIQSIRLFGFGSYSFFSSLPFLVPLIVYRIRNRIGLKGVSTYGSIVALVLIMVCSYKSVIVAPFLLSVVVLVLSVLGRRRLKSNLTILFLLITLYVIVPKHLIGGMFYAASNAVENREISIKLGEIGFGFTEGFEFVTYDDEARTGVEGRASRVLFNLKDFAARPIIGTGMQSNAHIYWLNLLAQFGLLGVIPLVMIIRKQVKKNASKMSDDSLFTYYLTVGAFIALGFMKAMGGYIMFILPLFIIPSMIVQEEDWLKIRTFSIKHTNAQHDSVNR